MTLSTDLVRRLFVIALLAWMSGIVPLATQVLEKGFGPVLAGAYEDPCAGCPDDAPLSENDAPCSPTCDDCLCGPGARVALERDLAAWELAHPASTAVLIVPALGEGLAPPQDLAEDGLLRPPRA